MMPRVTFIIKQRTLHAISQLNQTTHFRGKGAQADKPFAIVFKKITFLECYTIVKHTI